MNGILTNVKKNGEMGSEIIDREMGAGGENWPQVRASGDSAVLVEFENRIDPLVSRRVRSLALVIESDSLVGIHEVLPAYRSLMVIYDPLEISYPDLVGKIKLSMEKALNINPPRGRLFRLPTVYGGSHGPDLERVCQTIRLTPEEVIRIFSQARLLVYFIGFICGLAYLGGVPEILRLSRLRTPRTRVPAGSVGLASGQANAMPTDQPSGFNYIGRTFVSLYNPQVMPPSPFVPGDEIEFVSVSEEEALKARGWRTTDFYERI